MTVKELIRLCYTGTGTVSRIKIIAQTIEAKNIISTKCSSATVLSSYIAPIQKIYEDDEICNMTPWNFGIEDMQTIYITI